MLVRKYVEQTLESGTQSFWGFKAPKRRKRRCFVHCRQLIPAPFDGAFVTTSELDKGAGSKDRLVFDRVNVISIIEVPAESGHRDYGQT